jgi:hypothetical protein
MSYTTAKTLIKIKEPSGLLVGMHLALLIDRQEGNDDDGQFHRLCIIESITEVNGDYYLEFENLRLSSPVEILK